MNFDTMKGIAEPMDLAGGKPMLVFPLPAIEQMTRPLEPFRTTGMACRTSGSGTLNPPALPGQAVERPHRNTSALVSDDPTMTGRLCYVLYLGRRSQQ